MDNKDDKEILEEKDIIKDLNPEKIAEEAAAFDFGKDEGRMEKTDFGMTKSRMLEIEMQESYLDYAMSVIISRALPDVRDGLKPVHRRVLYTMNELGLTSN